MEFFYPFIIAFFLIFISELGDKTQLFIITISRNYRVLNILIGVALGSFFSHGIAILCGSMMGSIENIHLQIILNLCTNILFIIFGIYFLFFIEKNDKKQDEGIFNKLKNKTISYVFVIATSIAIGELGDKTFLASIGLGIEYPKYKISLIIGAIFGMVLSNFIAIIFGKLLSKKIQEKIMRKISGILFILFGIIGIIF